MQQSIQHKIKQQKKQHLHSCANLKKNYGSGTKQNKLEGKGRKRKNKNNKRSATSQGIKQAGTTMNKRWK